MKTRDVFGFCAPGYDAFMRLFGFYHVDTLKRLLPLADTAEPHALLDVAGGTGYLASRFTTGFGRIVVLDQSEGMLAVARRRGLETVRASALAMPFSDGTFDTVMCTDALHHIKDIEGAIAEMARVVKPGGTILIQEFDIRSAAGWCLARFEHLFLDRSRFITPDELRDVMTRHGLLATLHPLSRLEYVCIGVKQRRSFARKHNGTTEGF